MDPIANMVAQLSNANHKFKESVEMPTSKLKAEIARVLKEEGFIQHFRATTDRKQGSLKITMKYTSQKERIITGMKRVSKPGIRTYRGWQDIPVVQNGLGTAILSTSKGVMSAEKAREQKLGGEILFFVW